MKSAEYAKSQGWRCGQLPFGMDLGPDGRTLVPNQAEQAAIIEIKRLRAERRSASRGGGAEWARDRKQSGKQWTAKTVRDVLLAA